MLRELWNFVSYGWKKEESYSFSCLWVLTVCSWHIMLAHHGFYRWIKSLFNTSQEVNYKCILHISDFPFKMCFNACIPCIYFVLRFVCFFWQIWCHIHFPVFDLPDCQVWVRLDPGSNISKSKIHPECKGPDISQACLLSLSD